LLVEEEIAEVLIPEVLDENQVDVILVFENEWNLCIVEVVVVVVVVVVVSVVVEVIMMMIVMVKMMIKQRPVYCSSSVPLVSTFLTTTSTSFVLVPSLYHHQHHHDHDHDHHLQHNHRL